MSISMSCTAAREQMTKALDKIGLLRTMLWVATASTTRQQLNGSIGPVKDALRELEAEIFKLNSIISKMEVP